MPQTNIAELAGLSSEELNERAAKCLTGDDIAMLNYCTSHDAVHRDLIPEIERRGLWSQFTAALISARCYTEPGIVRHALIRTPRELTIAFIATCEGEAANG